MHSQDCACYPCRRERKLWADLAWAESHADLWAARLVGTGKGVR